MKGNRRHTIPLTQAIAETIQPYMRDGLLFPTRDGRPSPRGRATKNGSTQRPAFPIGCITTYAGHGRRKPPNGVSGQPHVIERVLAHQTGTISGVAAIYNRATYMTEMREALERWERHLAALLRSA